MRRLALLILVLLGLSGCHETLAPATSGGVVDGGLFLGRYTLKDPAKQPKSWPLSQDQLSRVSAWLEEHQHSFGMLLASPPPPSFSIVINRADGSRTQIDLFSINENWQKAIVVRNSDPAKNGILHVSEQERDALLNLVKASP